MAVSKRLQRFKDDGLLGCLNDSGITSENYKRILMFKEFADYETGKNNVKLGVTPIQNNETVIMLERESFLSEYSEWSFSEILRQWKECDFVDVENGSIRSKDIIAIYRRAKK